MCKNKTFISIIPARGGSKRLPRKNIRLLAGKPLISWTIESALGSKYIDKVIVSSDDDEILRISLETGAEIVKRPEYLGSETATTYDAVMHSLDRYRCYDYVVLLQPTSPLRTAKHIDEAIELLVRKNADAVVSVCEMDHNPLWSNTLSDDMSMDNFIDDKIKNKRSQDLPQYYRLNGAIYICEYEKLISEKTFFIKNNIYAYRMERSSSVDIDEEIDFKLVSILIQDR
ncbi:cytidylyltransferase domain-containing protein [Sphaerochaeta sp.]|uniref:acylneuraminate cytidylyltransferase family protein n=1 Tax=Sphaerochaeta sp. TaxID=1972642 RepID=UPI003D0DCF55